LMTRDPEAHTGVLKPAGTAETGVMRKAPRVAELALWTPRPAKNVTTARMTQGMNLLVLKPFSFVGGNFVVNR
jgi:hypothetical protein